MSYEEKQQPSAKTHSISMENRTKLNVTGVEDVESFDENAIIMNTSQGDLIVRGTGLHIGRISLDVGQLSVEGRATRTKRPRAASGRSFLDECTLTFRSSSRSWQCRC